jgi:signal transduction histidine kinase
MRGLRTTVLVTALVSCATTAAVVLLPHGYFAHRWPTLHVALETAASLMALFAGFLALGRLGRRTRVDEWTLACALMVFALLNVFFVSVPALSQLIPRDLAVWVTLAGRSLGAALFALAAFAPRHRLRWPGMMLMAAAAGAATAALLAIVLVGALAGRLPAELAATLPAGPARPDLGAHLALLALHLALAALYSAAAVGFLRRCRRLGDEFLGWLAVAAVLAAVSHINYALDPSQHATWVYNGDAYRLCFYAVLLAGSIREIWSYWRTLSEAAVVSERRRIACDLHDGLAQELACLARNLDSLGGQADDDALGRMRWAVERAQLESRRAVSTLARNGKAIEVALAETAVELAERCHVGLELSLASGARLSPARSEALVRIAGEAITNAARHSDARNVRLSLERDGPGVRLRVSDTGRGFDTAVPAVGFGLASMRERALSVGGDLRISSAPGRGTEVEAVL